MAIIYSYPETTQILLTDMLIGTSTIRVAGKKKNLTKNFTIETLGGFIHDNFPTQWGEITGTLSNQIDLQAALDSKQSNITLTTIGTSGPSTFIDSILNIPNYLADIPTKTSDLINDGEDGVHPFITAEDIPPSASTLNDVLTNGNTSLLDAKIGELYLYDTSESQYGKIQLSDSEYNLYNSSGDIISTISNVGAIFRTNAYYGFLNVPNTITANRTYEFPNASGTIALTSDIPGTLTFTTPLVNTLGTITINQSGASADGYLSSTNWNTFNNKQDTITLTTTGTSGVATFIANTLNIPSYSTDLSGYVPYTGAIQDVNLGEFGVQLGNIEFDTTPTNVPTGAGSLVWNDTDGTLDLKLKGGNVTLQVGQETVLRVVNKTATNISLLEANYQAVRVTGAQGQRLKVDLALATNDALSAETLGLVTETIANNQEGFITTSGLVRGINTTGSLQGETWVDGDVLYLSPTTAGNATKVKPVAPNHLIILGYVISAHITQGSIFVKVDNGYELDELHNVKITTPINNNVLAYTSASSIWENKTIDAVIGYTPISGTGTTNYLPKFTGTSALGNSLISESTNLININSASVLLDNNRFLRGKFVDGTVKDIIGINDGNEIVSANVGAFHFTNIANVYIDGTAVPTLNLSNSAGALGQLILESGATGNINIRGNGGTRLITLSQNGQMAVSKGTVSLLAQQTIYPYATTIKGQVIKGFTGQTANLQEWQDSIGTVLAAVTAAGNVGIGTAAPVTSFEVVKSSTFSGQLGSLMLRSDATSTKKMYFGFDDTKNYGYLQSVNTGVAFLTTAINPNGGITLIGSSTANGTANLQAYTSTDGIITTFGRVGGTKNSQLSFYGYETGEVQLRYTGSSGDQYLTFFSNSAEKMRITNAGNVGIGTTSPAAKLQVNAPGALSTDIAFKIRNSADSLDLIKVNGLGQTSIGQGTATLTNMLTVQDVFSTSVAIEFRSDQNPRVGSTFNTSRILSGYSSGTASFLDLQYAGGAYPYTYTTGLRLNSAGNVGIGTTAPAAKLQVNAPGALSTDLAFKIRNSADTSDFVLVDGTGNVGIGTTSGIFAKLDVNGTGRFIGSLKVSGLNEGYLIYQAGGAAALATYSANADTARFSFKYAQNFPASNNYTRVLDIISTGDSTGAGVIRLMTSVANAAPTTAMYLSPSGNIGIGTTAPAASAKVQIDSTTQGFLPPRMTNAERLLIATPAVGLCVYCTDVVEGLYINKSTGWTYIG